MKLLLNKPGLSPPEDPQGEKSHEVQQGRGHWAGQSPESLQSELQFLKFSVLLRSCLSVLFQE